MQYAEGCDGSIGPGAWLQPNRWRVEGFHLICRNLMESIYNKLWFFLKLSKTRIFKSLVHTCHSPILLVGNLSGWLENSLWSKGTLAVGVATRRPRVQVPWFFVSNVKDAKRLNWDVCLHYIWLLCCVDIEIYHLVLFHVVLCCMISYYIMLDRIVLYHVVSKIRLDCILLSYHNMSYESYYIVSYRIALYHVASQELIVDWS